MEVPPAEHPPTARADAATERRKLAMAFLASGADGCVSVHLYAISSAAA
jgi:hypothetical protein